MKKYRVAAIMKGIVFGLIGAAVIGFVVRGLWNALVPELFHGPMLTYWQALGLFILSKILFGGFHGRGHRDGARWKQRMNQRWEQMSPEDREKFRAGMANRWGGWCSRPPADAHTGQTPQGWAPRS